MDDKNIFSIYDLAIGTINNIYTYYGEQNHRARYFCYYGMNTDIEWLNGSDGGDDKANMVNYNTLPNNGQLNIADAKEPWSNIYSGIEKANLAIEGLQAYADLENDEGLRQLYGEALTLRAIAYIDLINAWGDVPARFVAITPETINLPREDRDVIYKQIIADLQTAQEYVAWPNERSDTQTVERINKAFVKDSWHVSACRPQAIRFVPTVQCAKVLIPICQYPYSTPLPCRLVRKLWIRKEDMWH